MLELVTTFHSVWRWLAVVLLVLVTLNGVYGWTQRRRWTDVTQRLALGAVIAVDIQVVSGLASYVMGRWWESGNQFRGQVHPLLMILTLAVLHVTWMRAKGTSDPVKKHRWAAVGGILAMILAVSGGALPGLSGMGS